MPVINTNVNAIIARNSGAVNDRSMTKAMQSLSTGKRINVASDDAAGLAIATKMTSQIRGLDQAVRNANDGISMLQVVEGATVEMTNMLQRMRELAVQSANDTNTTAERSYLDDEFQQLRAEIDRIAGTTQWNGVNMMDGSTGNIGSAAAAGGIGGNNVAFQVGANADAEQRITFNIANFDTAAVASTAATATVNTLNFATGLTDSTLSNLTSITLTDDAATPNTYTVDLPSALTGLTGLSNQTAWDAAAAALESALQAETGLADVTVTSTAIGVLQVSDASSTLRSWTIGLSGASAAEVSLSSGATSTTLVTVADNGTDSTVTANFGDAISGGTMDQYSTLDFTVDGADYSVSLSDFTALTSSSSQADWTTAATALQAKIVAASSAATSAFAAVTVTSSSPGVITITDVNDAKAHAWSADFRGTSTDATAITSEVANIFETAGEAGTSSSSEGVFADAALDDQDITTTTNAQLAIDSLDLALTALNEQRSAMGATINRLTYAADNLTNTSANTTAARSRVLDTDYASATTELARTQIIQQASTAMLAQANQGAQSVLSLLK